MSIATLTAEEASAIEGIQIPETYDRTAPIYTGGALLEMGSYRRINGTWAVPRELSGLPALFLVEMLYQRKLPEVSDERIPETDLRLDQNLQFVHGRQASLTRHAQNLLCGLTDTPSGFWRKQFVDMGEIKVAAIVLNCGLRNRLRQVRGARGSDFLIRYNREDVCRAILTHQYAIYDNHNYFEDFISAAPEELRTQLVCNYFYCSDDDLNFECLISTNWYEGLGGRWGKGITGRNSEIGNSSTSFRPFIYNTEGFSIRYPGERTLGAFDIRHYGRIRSQEIANRLREEWPNLLRSADVILELLLASAEISIPNGDETLAALAQSMTIQQEISRNWYRKMFERSIFTDTSKICSPYDLLVALALVAEPLEDNTRTVLQEKIGLMLTSRLDLSVGRATMVRRWSQYSAEGVSLRRRSLNTFLGYTSGLGS